MVNDILLDELGDLDFSGGDINIGSSLQQNAELILISFTGYFKQYPFIGFGLQKYLKTNVSQTRFKRELKLQLNYDGFNNPNISYHKGVLKLEV